VCSAVQKAMLCCLPGVLQEATAQCVRSDLSSLPRSWHTRVLPRVRSLDCGISAVQRSVEPEGVWPMLEGGTLEVRTVICCPDVGTALATKALFVLDAA
jgi:hypothetical protein